MLLPEFAKPNSGGVLSRSIDTAMLRDGMTPTATFPDIARTQFYFVDACRIEPKDLSSANIPPADNRLVLVCGLWLQFVEEAFRLLHRGRQAGRIEDKVSRMPRQNASPGKTARSC
jgi:hypothetical protein